MIKHLSNIDIDKAKWDNAIAQSCNGNLYAMSWFLDVVSPAWSALVNDDYSFVMPLPTRKKIGYTYMFQPVFTQQLGPFYQDGYPFEALQLIPKEYSYIDLNLKSILGFDMNGFRAVECINYTLSLSLPYDELFRNYAYNTKRNVRKCLDTLSLVEDFDDAEAINIFKKNRGEKISGYKNENYEILLGLLKVLKEKNKLEKWGVVDVGGILLASAHFAVYENTRVFLFSSISVKGKQQRAMFYLLDRFIHRYQNSNLILDFSGTNDFELGRFYKGFGSDKTIYYKLIKNKLPFFLKWFKK